MNYPLKDATLTSTELKSLEHLSSRKLVSSAMGLFKEKMALSSSFQMEESVLIHMTAEAGLAIKVFALDTGYLNAETFNLAKDLENKYGFITRWVHPDPDEVASLVKEKGKYSFYSYGHEECCFIRKVKPLNRVLQTLDAWMTGLRREQNPENRSDMKSIEVDVPRKGIFKINPLLDWTTEQIWQYIHENDIPYNRLYDLGYRSIGCAPCTRPVLPYEGDREGRWWWESKKECGLHFQDGAGI